MRAIFYNASGLLLDQSATNQSSGGGVIAHETAHHVVPGISSRALFDDVWMKEVLPTHGGEDVNPSFPINHELRFLSPLSAGL